MYEVRSKSSRTACINFYTHAVVTFHLHCLQSSPLVTLYSDPNVSACCKRFLEVFIHQPIKDCLRFGLYFIRGVETPSLELQLHFRKQRKVTRGQIRRVGWVWDDRHAVIRQKLRYFEGSMRWCIVVMQQPVAVTPQLRSLSSHVLS